MSKPVAIVTGGGFGIGEAVATQTYGKSYKVFIADLNPSSGERVAKPLGPDALFIKTDISICSLQVQMCKQAYELGGNRLDFYHADSGTTDSYSINDHMEKEVLDKSDSLTPIDMKNINLNLGSVIQSLWLFNYHVRRSKEAGGGKGHFVTMSSAAGL